MMRLRFLKTCLLLISTFILNFLFPLLAYPNQLAADMVPLKSLLQNQFKGSYPENPPAAKTIKSFELIASESHWGFIPPYQTTVWSYNDQIPGPVLRVKLGETVRIRLHNQLPQATTIHWHGIRVPNAMDGVPGVTQPAIASGASYTYEFTPKDAGTFWFHPHFNSAEQIERGLHGVLIVEDENEPVYSQDLVLVLDDWLLQDDWQINDHFVSGHDLAHDGRWGNVATVNGKYQPELHVKAGERIRLRMINVANGRVFAPMIAHLSPVVIAVDGMLTAQPFPLARFNLAPGNRIDLDLVIPKDAAGKRYQIGNIFSRNVMPLATLVVTNETAVTTPKFKAPQALHFPNWEKALSAPITHNYQLNAQRGGPYGIAWTIDANAWPDIKPLELKAGEFNRLRFTNRSARLHPMHLHGQFFKVISRNGERVSENFWRDTVLVGPRESLDIALVPIDRGTWVNHCHILEHAEAGMTTVIHVK